MSVISKLNKMQDKFTKKEKKISKYILDNLNEIMHMNTYEIADGCKTSQASVVRFAKKMGYSGFPEFKVDFGKDMGRREAKKKVNFVYEDLKDGMEIEEMVKKIVSINTSIIKDTYSIMNIEDIIETINLIRNSKRIMIIGAGYSGIIGRDLQYKLRELGIMAFFESDYHMQFSTISTLNEKDLIFVISQSGKTLDIYNLAKEAKKKSIKIISITQKTKNPISEQADINLYTVIEKNNFRSTALYSRLSQMTIIDVIYVALISKDKESAEKYIGHAMKAVSDFKIE